MPLFKLTHNPIMNMKESSAVLNALEKVLGSLCIVLMLFIVQKDASPFQIGEGISRIGFICAAVLLLLNFIEWGLYFSGRQSVAITLFFLVMLPPLYYASIRIWRANRILAGVDVLFAIVNFVHVAGNIK